MSTHPRTVVITGTDLPVRLRPTVEALIATHLATPATRPATCESSHLHDACGWHIAWRRGSSPGTTSCQSTTDAPEVDIANLTRAFAQLRASTGASIHIDEAPSWRASLGLDEQLSLYGSAAHRSPRSGT